MISLFEERIDFKENVYRFLVVDNVGFAKSNVYTMERNKLVEI